MHHCPPVFPPVSSRPSWRGPRIPSLVTAVLLAASGPAVAADSGRFTSEAASREVSQSLDRRFTLDGKLRAAEVARSIDGRFALHSTNTPKVGCDAFPDPLFANGFEN